METKTGTEKQVRKIKTRCYYTDYVNHAIRFYLSTPETLKTEGKRKADIDNWISVQAVFHCLNDGDRATVESVYRSHYRVPEGVRIHCQKTGADTDKTWMLITKVCAAIARRRGLV